MLSTQEEKQMKDIRTMYSKARSEVIYYKEAIEKVKKLELDEDVLEAVLAPFEEVSVKMKEDYGE